MKTLNIQSIHDLETKAKRYEDMPNFNKQEHIDKNWESQSYNLFKELVDLSNVSSRQDAMISGMVKAMNNSHRTIQSEFMIVLTKFIRDYGNVDSQYIDGRNKYAVDAAKRMAENA